MSRNVSFGPLLIAIMVSSIGCTASSVGSADTVDYVADEADECRCRFEADGYAVDLPCGVQACLVDRSVECLDFGVFSIDLECYSPDELTVEDGVCRGNPDYCYGDVADCPSHCDVDCRSGFCNCRQPDPPAQCEDQHGRRSCANVEGCHWQTAECARSSEGCQGVFTPIETSDAGVDADAGAGT